MGGGSTTRRPEGGGGQSLQPGVSIVSHDDGLPEFNRIRPPCIVTHHAVDLVLQDMTVVHVRMSGIGRLREPHIHSNGLASAQQLSGGKGRLRLVR